MVAVTAALFLVSAGLVAYDRYTFRGKMLGDLTALADAFGDRSAAALNFLDRGVGGDDLRAFQHIPHIVGAALYDKDGKLFAEYGSSDFPRTRSFQRRMKDTDLRPVTSMSSAKSIPNLISSEPCMWNRI